LIAFAALAWFDWQGRRTGSPMLTLTVNGTPTPVAPDGAFEASVPADGAVTLLALTDAGDATLLVLP
jgi:hypothetical protein